MDAEQLQLDTLLKRFEIPDDLCGEMTFGALYDEARLDIASPFFQGDGYEVLKRIGLREPLLNLLDELMIQREVQGQACYRDGLLRLGNTKAVVQWLPAGAAQEAAQVRREGANLIPWLRQTLEAMEEQAIADKKTRAENPAHWKREKWLSPEKNRAIKAALASEGERLGFQVLPSGKRGEWLYDLVWRRLDGNRNIIDMPLAVEIEVSDSRLGGIRYDFNKLLQAQADHKLMVFQVKTPDDIDEVFMRLVQSIHTFPHAHVCRYLLCGWSTQQNAFHFHECFIEAAS